jgi:predicted O-methyltransferase YrrM
MFIVHADKPDPRGYLPSFEFEGRWVDERHERMPELVRDIPGWLRDEDVLKLYELGRLTPGPVLEVGSYRGKSAVVLASAIRAAGAATRLVSIDIDPEATADARRAVRDHGLGELVTFVRGSLHAFRRNFPEFRPSLVFLDGDHSLEGVRSDLALLRPMVPDGGLVLFHDYLDDRNADGAVGHIDVLRGVRESWAEQECEFGGTFGCCGLYRRRAGGPAGPSEIDPRLAGGQEPDGLPPLLDLVRHDTLRLRYLQRVRRPLGRWARRRLGRAPS